ncbi:Cytochrome c oxidase assembly protein COX16, mitochondrial [Choanephora cucurbitarum]|uniref:Cytochrome c oxidase assembly protein COX16, mitochondrial n=1 Tax=Choanephora cucurbitarum TaxID=101091 RepID=A0A1C7NIJ2_9FUNG|nr:Cytochrome c oxidase assembly protein COX16, mitochondrial [Choanephora cucurbitarum]
MVKFDKRPYGQRSTFDPLISKAKQRPFLFFGLPFVSVMVVGSFGLAQLTQTKYDHRDRRHTVVAKEEALGMDKSRRKLSLQEEYFRLQAKTEDEWEQVRIGRPQEKKP